MTNPPTLVVHWAVKVINVDWQSYGGSSWAVWESNTVAQLAVSLSISSQPSKIVIDISTSQAAKPMAIPDPPHSEVYSSKRTYVIRCGADLQLYRVADNQLLAETTILPPLPPDIICSNYVEWAPDESAAVIMAGNSLYQPSVANRKIYIWRTEGSAPKEIAETVPFSWVAWATDSKRLAFISAYDEKTMESTAGIIDPEGHALVAPFGVGRGYDGGTAILGWLTDDVLANYQRNGLSLFQVSTSQHLFDWWDSPASASGFHQPLKVSPNQRWITVDQGGYTNTSEGGYVQKRYSVYDIHSKTSYLLADTPDNYLKFAGWKDDSSTLYMVSRPATKTAFSGPTMPFGLIAFDPVTHNVDLLFKDAIKTEWNSDKSWAFVVFPMRLSTDKVGMASGLWKVGSTELVGRQLVSEQIIYEDPAEGTFFKNANDILPAVWSHDGTWLVFGNAQGQIIVLSTTGEELKLTDDFPRKEWTKTVFRWSPDDRHLIVQLDGRTWIATLPESLFEKSSDTLKARVRAGGFGITEVTVRRNSIDSGHE